MQDMSLFLSARNIKLRRLGQDKISCNLFSKITFESDICDNIIILPNIRFVSYGYNLFK